MAVKNCCNRCATLYAKSARYCGHCGLAANEYASTAYMVEGNAKKWAVATGEHRPPKAGELYISGALPMAYRAPNDFGTSYNIARAL